MCYLKTMQFWAIASIKMKIGIKIVHCINNRLLENIEHKIFSTFKVYFSTRKFLQMVNKTTASQNVRAETQIIHDHTPESLMYVTESVEDCHMGGSSENITIFL